MSLVAHPDCTAAKTLQLLFLKVSEALGSVGNRVPRVPTPGRGRRAARCPMAPGQANVPAPAGAEKLHSCIQSASKNEHICNFAPCVYSS